MTFEKPQAGQWVQPIGRGYKLACCDCGLVHRMDFRVYSRRAQFRAFRDERATGQMRRWMKPRPKPCVDEAVIAECDPGIRDVVRRLQELGFNTSDSGDGVSKPKDWYESGEAIQFPHVACGTTPEHLQAEADRLHKALGKGWNIEATYFPNGRKALLLATKLEAAA